MFTRIFWLVFIVSILYILFIFVAPDISDTYWNKEINTKIRNIKDKSLQIWSGWDSPVSIFEKLKWTTNTYFNESKNTIKTIETTVNTKVDQAKDVSVAVENAYSGVVDVAQKIQILTGTGVK